MIRWWFHDFAADQSIHSSAADQKNKHFSEMKSFNKKTVKQSDLKIDWSDTGMTDKIRRDRESYIKTVCFNDYY